MPFEVSWYQPERVVLLKTEGHLTVRDVEGIVAQTGATLYGKTDLVHFLVDVRGLQKIENIPAALKAVQSGPVDPHMGWMLIVGKMNPMVKFAMDFVGLLTQSRYRRFDDMPEALTFLKEIDGTLILS